jgi:hypothetical protein
MPIQYNIQTFQRKDKQQRDKDIQMLLLPCVSTVLYTVRSESGSAHGTYLVDLVVSIKVINWYRDGQRTLHELKTAITGYVRNISQADLQKVFANKIKRVQACIDARGHHLQQML